MMKNQDDKKSNAKQATDKVKNKERELLKLAELERQAALLKAKEFNDIKIKHQKKNEDLVADKSTGLAKDNHSNKDDDSSSVAKDSSEELDNAESLLNTVTSDDNNGIENNTQNPTSGNDSAESKVDGSAGEAANINENSTKNDTPNTHQASQGARASSSSETNVNQAQSHSGGIFAAGELTDLHALTTQQQSGSSIYSPPKQSGGDPLKPATPDSVTGLKSALSPQKNQQAVDHDAVISGTLKASIIEDKDVDHGNLHTNGQLTVTDLDAGQAQFAAESLHGQYGEMTIDNSGHWTYIVDNSGAKIQGLKSGEQLTETLFVHSIDGTQQKVTIEINGTDDKAVITGTSIASLTEDKGLASGGNLQADGQLTAIDPDTGQAQFTADHLQGRYGEMTIDNTGYWTYTVDNFSSTVQGLKTGEQLTETLLVHSVDGTEQKITVTINGVDDRAVIAGTSTASLTEDKDLASGGNLRAEGQLNITDPDAGQSQFTADHLQGQYGKMTIDHTGHWTYTVDNSGTTVQGLKTGEQLTETLLVHSVDGTEQKVTVTINGTDDKAVITGTSTASLTEDKGVHGGVSSQELRVDGALNVTDIDNGQAQFNSGTLQGQFGTFSINELGHWTYTADNSQASIQGLKSGQSLQETLVVHSVDGTEQNINITINGTNDGAVIGGQDTGGVKEESQLKAAGRLSVTDTDSGEAHFSDTDYKGTLGTLHMTDAGAWTYDLDNTNPIVQALGAGSTTTDTITVQSVDGTSHDIKITIEGTNDVAIVTDVGGHHVKEDTNLVGSLLVAKGQLGITDIDTGEAYFKHEVVAGKFGNFAIDKDGNWQYTADNSQTSIQQLASGHSIQDEATIMTADGSKHDLAVIISGTADHPVIHVANAAASASVKEDLSPTASGALVASAVDHTNSLNWSVKDSDGTYGSLSIDSTTGKWTYTLAQGAGAKGQLVQGLKEGEAHTDVFRAIVTDQHGSSSEQDIVIHVAGTNDAAVISGQDTGSVFEHSNHRRTNMSPDYAHHGLGKIKTDLLYADGKLLITDEAGENSFDSRGGGLSYHGTYGHLILHPDGVWQYEVALGKYDVDGRTSTSAGRTIDQLGAGESITDTVTVQSKDGTTHDIVITIHGDNDKPYCSSEVHLNSGLEDTAQTLTLAQLLQNTVDVDKNDAGQLSIDNLHADHGSIAINADGSFTFIPTKDYNGNVHFTYDVKDAHGGVTHTGATTTLAAVNDASTLASASAQASGEVTEDKTASASSHQLMSPWNNLDVTDVDGSNEANIVQIEINGVVHQVPTNFAISLQGDHGTFTTTHSTDGHNKWRYTADNSHSEIQGLKDGQSLTDSMTLITADGTRIPITATIKGTDDQVVIDTPAATTASLGTAIEDSKTSISGTLLAHDSDTDDTVHFQAQSTTGSYGTLTVNANGSWHYDIDHTKANSLGASDNKAEGFDVVAISSDGSKATQHIQVNVQGTNDQAVITGNSTSSIAEADIGDNVTASGTLTITDVDTGDNPSFPDIASVATTYGHITMQNGQWTYTVDQSKIQDLSPNNPDPAKQTVTDTHTFTASDGTTQTVSIVIKGTNDAPVIASAITDTETEGGTAATVNLLQGATDLDSATLSIASVTYAVGNGASSATLPAGVTLGSDGHTLTIDPSHAAFNHIAAGTSESITVNYQITDGSGGSVNQTATLTVTGTNDKPVIDAVSAVTAVEGGHTAHKGQITVTDADTGDTDAFTAIAPTTGQHIAGFTLNADGSYKFDATDAGYDHLAVGQTEQVRVAVTVTDASGATDQKDLIITITGTNDRPTVVSSLAQHIHAIDEDTTQHFTAKDFGFIDKDHGDQLDHITITALPDAYKGTFEYDGHPITIPLDVPTADISKITFVPAQDYNGGVQFGFTVNDGHTDSFPKIGNFEVKPIDDVSVISGDTSGALNEGNIGDTTTATGHLAITDVDVTDTPTFPDVASIATTYGHISMVKGQWTYTVDQSKIQDLDPNDNDVTKHQVTDHHTFTASDGSTQVVDIVIKGTNDKPIIESAHAAPAGSSSTLKIDDFEMVSTPTGANIDVAPTDAENTARWGTDQVEVGVGMKLVGLYKPGSDQNWIQSGHEATITTGHSSAGGYSMIDSHGWWAANHVPDAVNTGSGGATGHGNAWTGGIAVFQAPDGTQHIGIVNRVCAGGGSTEHDYLYFHSYANLHPGASIIKGQGTAGETITVKDDQGHTITTAVVDTHGHWEVAAAALGNGQHTLHIENAAGQSSPDRIYDISGNTVADNTPAGLTADIKEDTAHTVINGELRTSDTDHGDNPAFIAQADHATKYGHFSIDAAGKYHYTIDNNNANVNHLGVNQSIQEHITVTAKTADGEVATHDVVITINGSVDAPTLSASAATAQQGSLIGLNLHAALTDTGGDAETLTLKISGLPDTASLNHGTYDSVAKYWVLHGSDLTDLKLDMKDPNFHGDLHFNVTATATSGGESESTTQSVSLHVNAPPVVASALTDTEAEGSTAATIDLLQGATDADNAALSIASVTYAVGSGASSPTLPAGVTLGSDGHTLTIDPSHAAFNHLAAGASENITVSYQITDGAGGLVNQTATLTVTGTNDAAVISGIDSDSTLVEDQHLLSGKTLETNQHQLTSVDVDGTNNLFQPTGTAHGTGSAATGTWIAGDNGVGQFILHADGRWLFKCDNANVQHLGDGDVTTDTITVHSADGTPHVLTASVTGTNDQPTVSAVALVGAEDTDYTFSVGNFGFTDVDTGDTLAHVTITSLPDPFEGQFLLDGIAVNSNQQIAASDLGKLVFIPAENFNGDVHFKYTVNDGTVDSTEATGTLNLAAVADAAKFTDGDKSTEIHEDNANHLYANGQVIHSNEHQLVFNDPDAGENFIVSTGKTTANAQASDHGQWVKGDGGVGEFVVNANGKWDYKIDNTNTVVQSLKSGEKYRDTITIHSKDGTSHTLTVEVAGTDDKPTITVGPTQSVTEDGTATATGTIATSDVDSGDTATMTAITNQAGTYGHLTMGTNGQWSYTLDNASAQVQGLKQGQTETDTFTVTSTSTDGSTTTSQLVINVAGTNDSPVVHDIDQFAPASTSEFVLTPAMLQGQFSDADGDTIDHLNLVSGHANVYKVENGKYITFDGTHNEISMDDIKAGLIHMDRGVDTSFSFTATDSGGQTSVAANFHLDIDHKPIITLNGLNPGVSHDAAQIATQLQMTEDQGGNYQTVLNLGIFDPDTTFTGSAHQDDRPEITSVVIGDGASAVTATHDASGWHATTVMGTYTWDNNFNGNFTLNNSASAVQQLGAGESALEKITIASVTHSSLPHSNGVTSEQVFHLEIKGTNDAPVAHHIDDINQHDSSDGTSIHVVLPKNAFTDADHLDTFTLSASLGDGSALPSWLKFDAATGTLSGKAPHSADGDFDIKVTATDSNGGHASHDFHLTVTDMTGDVKEDGRATGVDYSVNGQLETHMVSGGVNQSIVWHEHQDGTDASPNHMQGTYGFLQMSTGGTWIYHVDHDGDAHYSNSAINALKGGEVVQETFNIFGYVNGALVKTDTITVNVEGTNDAATINGVVHSTSSGSLSEDDVTSTITGSLNLSDHDHGENLFTADPHIAGTYGHVALAADGSWTYQLDNNLATTNALNTGDHVTDSITVHSPDGTADHMIEVNITGHTDTNPIASPAHPPPPVQHDEPAPLFETDSFTILTDADDSLADAVIGHNPIDHYLDMLGLDKQDIAADMPVQGDAEYLTFHSQPDTTDGADPLIDDLQFDGFDNPLDEDHQHHTSPQDDTFILDEPISNHDDATVDDSHLHSALNNMHSQF